MNRRSLLLAAVAAPLAPAPAVAIPRNFVRAMQAHLAESDRIWAEYGQEVWFVNTTVGSDRSEPWQ
jgi:hypothetical protein